MWLIIRLILKIPSENHPYATSNRVWPHYVRQLPTHPTDLYSLRKTLNIMVEKWASNRFSDIVHLKKSFIFSYLKKSFFLFLYGEIETVTWQSFFITYLITLYVHFTVCLNTVKTLFSYEISFFLVDLPSVLQFFKRILRDLKVS